MNKPKIKLLDLIKIAKNYNNLQNDDIIKCLHTEDFRIALDELK